MRFLWIVGWAALSLKFLSFFPVVLFAIWFLISRLKGLWFWRSERFVSDVSERTVQVWIKRSQRLRHSTTGKPIFKIDIPKLIQIIQKRTSNHCQSPPNTTRTTRQFGGPAISCFQRKLYTPPRAGDYTFNSIPRSANKPESRVCLQKKLKRNENECFLVDYKWILYRDITLNNN